MRHYTILTSDTIGIRRELVTYPIYTLFFVRNHFIRNLHVEGRNIQGTYTNKGKIPKELFIFKFRVLYSDESEDYITLDEINGIGTLLLD